MHAIAGKAVAFHEAMQPGFVEYQRAILENAQTLAAELQKVRLRLISGGTDTHLVLVDLSSINVTGRTAEESLGRACIVVNRNSIPFDPLPAMQTSGIRLGTPAITSRGFGKEEVKFVAASIVKVISNVGNRDIEQEVRRDVHQLCSRFPVPGIDV